MLSRNPPEGVVLSPAKFYAERAVGRFEAMAPQLVQGSTRRCTPLARFRFKSVIPETCVLTVCRSLLGSCCV